MQYQLWVQSAGHAGNAQQIPVEAVSEAEAIRKAVKNGWRVLSIDSAYEDEVSRPRSAKEFPLLQFSQEMLALLEAGLNLTEAIHTLHAKEFRQNVKAILADILKSLERGKSFSDTLAAMPGIFPDIYTATVRASERSGNLGEALGRFVAYQLQFDAIKKKLVSAAIYPSMLLLVGGFVTLFLLGYVVPKFSAVYETSGRDVPLMSQILLKFGTVIHNNSLVVIAAFLCLLGAAVYAMVNPELRQKIINSVLRIPVLSSKAEEFRLARFYRALSLLLHAGIPLSKAMMMVEAMLLPSQQEALQQTRKAVEEGQSFSSALESMNLATPVAQSLLKVGENTGRLGDMLERSAKFHDEDFARWVDWFSRLLEPVLMTFIGVVIGAVVVLMYMPIFELAGSLS